MNVETIPRGTARAFRARIYGYAGAESLRLCVGTSDGAVAPLVKTLSWDTIVNPDYSDFTCTITAAETNALTSGVVYRAVVWRINSGAEHVPIIDGRFRIVDTPRHA